MALAAWRASPWTGLLVSHGRVQAPCEAKDGEVGSWKEGSEEKRQAGTDGGATP